MSTEKEGHDETEHVDVVIIGKKTHQTHFSGLETPLEDNDYDSGYEWVDMGNGRSKRVPKKTEDKK